MECGKLNGSSRRRKIIKKNDAHDQLSLISRSPFNCMKFIEGDVARFSNLTGTAISHLSSLIYLASECNKYSFLMVIKKKRK
jgi:hypothetical protein